MRLDLHLHSLASDGSESPTRVIETAAAVSLDVIALTDHDTTEGVASAREAARYLPVEVIAGIEVSTTHGGMELHILGYFVDPSAPRLKAHETRAKNVREERMREMIRRLATEAVEVSFDDVVEAAGPTRHSLGRPHLARALVRAGYVTTISEAFDRYIGNGHAAYIPTALVTPEEGIAIILAAGGIPVWAHPPFEAINSVLPQLVQAGLRGLEVYRPRTPADKILRLERSAKSVGLLVSGGSDWHGPDSGTLGGFYVTGEEVAKLLEAGGI